MLSVGKCNAYGMTGEINNRRYGWGEWMSEYTNLDTGMNDSFLGDYQATNGEWAYRHLWVYKCVITD